VGWVASEREGHERGTGSGHENVVFWKASSKQGSREHDHIMLICHEL
jgi:hypothetical protein